MTAGSRGAAGVAAFRQERAADDRPRADRLEQVRLLTDELVELIDRAVEVAPGEELDAEIETRPRIRGDRLSQVRERFVVAVHLRELDADQCV